MQNLPGAAPGLPQQPQGRESAEIANIRRQLLDLKSAVNTNVETRINEVATNCVTAIMQLRNKPGGITQAELQQLASVITQSDAQMLADQINNQNLRNALGQLMNEVGTAPAGAPQTPTGAPGRFNINDPLASIKSMPIVQRIQEQLQTKFQISPALFESGLSMFVTMALTKYTKIPAIGAAVAKMKAPAIRQAAQNDPEITRLLSQQRPPMTLDQAMNAWNAAFLDAAQRSAPEPTLRQVLQAQPQPAPAAPPVAPNTPPAAPKDVTASGIDAKIGESNATLKLTAEGALTVKIGDKTKTITVTNLKITKATVDAKGDLKLTVNGQETTLTAAAVLAALPKTAPEKVTVNSIEITIA